MKIKAAIVAAATAALLATPLTASAGQRSGDASTGSWAIAISDYSTGSNIPANAIYVAAGSSWAGELETNDDGKLKIYTHNIDGSTGLRRITCADDGPTDVDVVVTVSVTGEYSVTCS